MISFRANKSFASSEHKLLGNIKLWGLPDDFTHFVLKNEAKVTFGDIISLAGDYYGVPTLPISEGSTPEEVEQSFLKAYAMLDNASPEDVRLIVHAIDQSKAGEENSIGETLAALKSLHLNYIKLAENNIDHFNLGARTTFFAGYALALKEAVQAAYIVSEKQRKKHLEYAYSLLAFSCHFLTDLFASGHIRTPRIHLQKQFGPQIGSMLSLFQHTEDGEHGLEVASEKINEDKLTIWRAYGDKHLAKNPDNENLTRALSAVQQAVDEVYQAFINKKITSSEQSKISKLIPQATENNFPPMFKVDDKDQLLYRVPIGGEPKDQYEKLTLSKALEIIFYYAKNYPDKDTQESIELIKNKFEPKISKISFLGIKKKDIEEIDIKNSKNEKTVSSVGKNIF